MADPEFLSALRASAFELLDDQCAIERVHRHVDGAAPFDAELWRTVAELGWTTIAVPERFGGMGGGVDELSVLQEALGAHVAPLPFLGTALLGLSLAAWDDQARAAELLPRLAEGAVVGGVADPAASGPLILSESGGNLVLDGEVAVIDGAAADWMLVHVEDESSRTRGLAILAASAPGLDRTVRPMADRTRSLARLTCRRTPLEPSDLMVGDAGAKAAADLRRAACLLLSSDSIGGGGAILSTTVDYLKTRVQFGKPLGSFQALKHRAADLKVSLEMARGLVAAAVVQHARCVAPEWAAMAKASACETYLAIASDAVQMHGGIGFTWEHQAHLFLKRAALDRALFGAAAAQQDQIAASLIAGAA